MSRGLSTANQLKVIHKRCCSIYSSNIARKCSGPRDSTIHLSQITRANNFENDIGTTVINRQTHSKVRSPYLPIDLNFVRHLSTGKSCYEAAGGPPPSPPDNTTGGSATSGDGGNDDRLVCPKCGSPCEHVNSFVAATRYDLSKQAKLYLI